MPQLELRAQLEPDPEVLRRLDGIEGKVDLTLENQETTMIDLAKLKDAVAAINDVVKQLTQTADTVDAAVAANPSTPNLAASPPTP